MATDWSRLTVVDLRQELKRRGLAQAGKKVELVERLTLADDEPVNDDEPDVQTAEEPDDVAKDSPKHKSPTLEAQRDSSKELDTAPHPIETKSSEKTDAITPSKLPNNAADADVTPQPVSEPVASIHQKEDVQKKEDKDVSTESASAVPEVSQDANNRKRRSRSPPPEDESSRKRVRPSDEVEKSTNGFSENPDPNAMPLDIIPGKDVSYAIIQPNISTDQIEHDSRTRHGAEDEDQYANRDVSMLSEDRNEKYLRPASRDQDAPLSHDSARDEDDCQVTPSEHPATSALYIKNFMRPLRENMLLEHLSDLAVPRRSEPDPDAVEEFFLDQIRTHAFVRFRNVSAASRVRVALHGKVWPNERERKELWVDFIPPEKVEEWSNHEKTEGSRGTRWEVRYDFDSDGNATARLTNADAEPPRQPSRPQPPPSAAPVASIPTGPSRQFTGVEGAPLGPRGRGTAAYRQDSFPTSTGDWKQTQARPPLPYKPVASDLAERRIDNMRSYYTKDRYRDMGREDEINRYTFENQDGFVDRGKENFVGIRPPHREREIQQRRAQERGGSRGGSFPSYGGPPRGGDRYFGSGRDVPSRDAPNRDMPSRDMLNRDMPNRGDEPRSRLNGAPMPTFDAYRGGGRGGGGGGRRGWRR